MRERSKEAELGRIGFSSQIGQHFLRNPDLFRLLVSFCIIFMTLNVLKASAVQLSRRLRWGRVRLRPSRLLLFFFLSSSLALRRGDLVVVVGASSAHDGQHESAAAPALVAAGDEEVVLALQRVFVHFFRLHFTLPS